MFEGKINAMNADPIGDDSFNPLNYPGKRTYTVDEIQDILGVSRPTAYNLVKKNLFRSVRVGGSIRISKRSFDEWLDTAQA